MSVSWAGVKTWCINSRLAFVAASNPCEDSMLATASQEQPHSAAWWLRAQTLETAALGTNSRPATSLGKFLSLCCSFLGVIVMPTYS